LDTNGARHLQKRLEAHEHWRQADAVVDGRQPANDPDVHELEGIGDGVRLYGCEARQATVHARPALVTFRMTKALVDGAWERSVIEESVEYLDTHPGTGRIEPRTA
jgi:hypothetical protein